MENLNAEREQITSSNNDLYKYVRRIIESVEYKGNLDHDDVPTILREFARGYEQRIGELTEENERLSHHCDDCAGCTQWKCDCSNIQADTVQKYREKLYRELAYLDAKDKFNKEFFLTTADQIAKEMLEGKDEIRD